MLSTVKRTARRRLDHRLGPLLALRSLKPPPKGWIRAIRDSLGMTGAQLARRLDISWQSMDDLEKSEAAGTIGLNALRRVAAALDCTVVYAVVPNTSLEDTVQKQSRAKAVAALRRVDQTMVLEDQRVTDVETEQLIADYIADHVRDRDLWDK